MAILKAKYDNKEDIPAGFEELFEERGANDEGEGGQWLLKRDAIEGIKTEGDVQRVQRALSKATTEKKELKKKLDAFGDHDPEQLAKDLDELEELRAKAAGGDDPDDAQKEEIIQKRIEAAKRPLERKLAELEKERDEYKGQTEELVTQRMVDRRESHMRKAATAAGLRNEAIEDAILYADHFEENDEGKFVTKEDVPGVTPGLDAEVWFSEMKDKRPHWWPASQGGGAEGNRGGSPGASNPFSQSAWNKTEQGRLAQSDPKKAEQFAKRAGFPSLEAAEAAIRPPKQT